MGKRWRGLPSGKGYVPPLQIFSFLGLKMRRPILVHSPVHLSTGICFCTVYVRVQTSSTPTQSDIPGWLWLNQRRWVPGEEGTEHYATNLNIANVEALSHDDSNSHNFSSDGHEFGVYHWPLAASPPLHPPLVGTGWKSNIGLLFHVAITCNCTVHCIYNRKMEPPAHSTTKQWRQLSLSDLAFASETMASMQPRRRCSYRVSTITVQSPHILSFGACYDTMTHTFTTDLHAPGLHHAIFGTVSLL